jgi:hypothetical protein
LRRTIARVVTIEQACRRMDVDLAAFLAALNRRSEQKPSACPTAFLPREALTIQSSKAT